MLVDFAELGRPLWLSRPRQVFAAHRPEEVAAVLQAAEKAADGGAWVGGFLAYEAATAFGLPVKSEPSPWPLAWFAVFDGCDPALYPAAAANALALSPPAPQVSWEAYRQAIQQIGRLIHEGDTYQVNYTLPTTLHADETLADAFCRLQVAHRLPYAAWVNTGDQQIASLSPELFLQREGGMLTSGPIKGTAPRRGDVALDQEQINRLLGSAKDRAEHVMIVDMVRNDLNRICRGVNVAPGELASRRTFSSVHHLETRVCGELRHATALPEIMAAMFPAASITGAPKYRTMEIIRDLEAAPRGVYTGAIGIIPPGGDFIFNVAIRTLTSSPQVGQFEIGLGGGIVADSLAEAEWREISDKGRFIQQIPPAPGLIETMAVDAGGTVLQQHEHLDRLQASAAALGIACDSGQVRARIEQRARQLLEADELPAILRLCYRSGEIAFDHRMMEGSPTALTVGLSPLVLDQRDHLLRHKTTRRQLYDHGLGQARRAGYDDTLFLNTRGHITEGAIRALAVRLAGQWFVPPLSDGLLDSLWRRQQIKLLGAVERSLSLDDLASAEEILMGNSVRGTCRVGKVDCSDGQGLYRAPI